MADEKFFIHFPFAIPFYMLALLDILYLAVKHRLLLFFCYFL